MLVKTEEGTLFQKHLGSTRTRYDIIVETREGRLFRKKHLRRNKLKSILERQLWCDKEEVLFQKQLETSVVKFTSTRRFVEIKIIFEHIFSIEKEVMLFQKIVLGAGSRSELNKQLCQDRAGDPVSKSSG